ncbi:hypothetical protein [Flavobacterium wongokense]|uniref:hypothetical protein n=1 Tax=Flavobacterium wongokense TaxID=2910674 RepID=UPI001F1AB100|nr:hypothetical protein [Flavobacterium sp. WG47]MCF6132163.1 hypothetical protein [Flavobacterium sp. WG47]
MDQTKSLHSGKTSNHTRTVKLCIGIIFDLIGMSPSLFPPLALIWAPFSAFVLATMYKGKTGKIAGIFDFAEELLPIVDFVPTFTITWFYVYKIKGGK